MAPMQMTSVAFVLRHKPSVNALVHVAELVSSYLDPSSEMTLARACTFNSIRLLDHIWAQSCVSAAERTAGWSRFNWLRSDRVYYKWQFREAVPEAARCGHLDVIRWLFAHFEDCSVSNLAVVKAIQAEQYDVLPLLLSRDPQDDHEQMGARRNRVEWGGTDMREALVKDRPDIARWLHQHTSRHNSNERRRQALQVAQFKGDISFVEWLLERDCPFDPLEAAESGNSDVIRWLFARGEAGDTVSAIAMASMASNGNLEMVQWVLEQHPPTNHFVWQECWTSALKLACKFNHLDVVRFLMQNRLSDQFVKDSPQAMHDAAYQGHLDLAKFFRTQSFGKITAKTMLYAAAYGHADVVQWLHDEFAFSIPLYRKLNYQFIDDTMVGTAMDAAAVKGQLDVLELLHSFTTNNPGSQQCRDNDAKDGAKQQKPWTTQEAMVGAAAGGHLDVVKWLYHHGSDGNTTQVMDMAADGGHLDVVKWLHSHTNVGCSSKAMDLAAEHGHLDVVQWLHHNRSEGCTTDAMDNAAEAGHLDVIKWLHRNRSEGCTDCAVVGNPSNWYPEVAHWLILHRPECADPEPWVLSLAANYNRLDLFRWLQKRFPDKLESSGLLQEEEWHVDAFEILLYLHTQNYKLSPEIAATVASTSKFPINAWIHLTY